MCVACDHTIHRAKHHFGWNRDFAPALTAKPGATIHFECMDSSGGQLGADSTRRRRDRPRFRQGQSGHRPGLCRRRRAGRCAEGDASASSCPRASAGPPTSPASACSPTSSPIRRCTSGTMTRASMAPALYGPGGKVPLKPFAGTIGARAGRAGPAFRRAAAPRRRQYGHPRHRRPACTLYLPVEVEGALFSIGDTHAAQGDGEVCGTAIESQMNVDATLELVKGAQARVAALHHARAR